MSAPTAPSRPTLRRRLLQVHRWLSLGAAIFWLLQALTGILIVFHWEFTDATISSVHRPTDFAAIERRIDALVPSDSGAKMNTVWNTAGAPDRYNLYFEDAGGNSGSVRIAGDGTILHTPRPDEETLMGFLVGFHHDLLGSWGSWIVSISGILLFSNLLLGLIAAWPKRGTWKLALKPATRGPAAARLYSWHRAMGLWAVIPALVIVGTGTLLKFEGGTANLLGAEPVAMPANPPVGAPVGFATAATAATAVIPGSTLTSVAWPKADDATYAIRVRAPGEIRRAYGDSRVLVDANTGQVRGIFPIADAPAARAFMSSLFPIHTGEAGGLIGRLLSIAIGLWLVTMIVAGTLLWLKRRKPRRAG
ncbi:PepSY-associated TM helix domain-containing protein [Sphingomonas sp. LT1P40]|uniref:PepSY-associated TM helix domain-containing protein n=1 Tax=Alteristakelama amylovorans TaxID=3096166 RepID=UPI002FC8FF12